MAMLVSTRLPRLAGLTRGLAKKAKGGGKGRSSAPKASAGAANILTLTQVRKTIPGGRVLLDNVNLGLLAGAKVGVLGANGCGKSSMLKLLAGKDLEYEVRAAA